MPLRVAIVGCGKTADMHAQGLQRLPTARMVAVCDREALMAEQLAIRYRIPKSYNDFTKLLAIEKPDVIHIATPPQSHLPLAMEALDAGCHLLVEKPLGLDASEALRIMRQADSQARKLTIAYTYYFDPAARMLRTLVSQGAVGEPVHLESFLGYNLKGAFGPSILADRDHWVRKLPGKLFHNLLDHLLNQVTEFLTDEEPLVQALSWQNATHSGDLPDELRVIMSGNNGSGHRISAYATLSSHVRPAQHFLRFYGTKCIAHLDFDHSTITLDRPPNFPGVLGRLESPFVQGWRHIRQGGKNVFRFARSDYHFFSGFHYLLSQFYNSIVNDGPVPISQSEILRTARLVDEVVRQVGSPQVANR